MRYALVAGEQVEAAPKLQGTCRCCAAPTIAKCGKFKVWHWAHKSKEHCDQWWEAETQWHRDWKALFPQSCQEVIHFDDLTGEKHIADVETESGLVVELQHSILKPEELTSRESFYGPLIWIVDGCRSDFDKTYFSLGFDRNEIELPDGTFGYGFSWYGRSKFFHRWALATKPVFVDFGSDALFQLVGFDTSTSKGIVQVVRKEEHVAQLLSGRFEFDREKHRKAPSLV